MHQMSLTQRLSGATPFPARLLNRGARNCAERTKHTTVAWVRAQKCPAAGAFIEKLTCIGRHHLGLRGAAGRTGDGGFRDYGLAHAKV